MDKSGQIFFSNAGFKEAADCIDEIIERAQASAVKHLFPVGDDHCDCDGCC